MAHCPHCGQPLSSSPAGAGPAPWQNQSSRPVALGCGSLILIALIVLFFSRPSTQQLENQIKSMQGQMEILQKRASSQTNELQKIRNSLDTLVKGQKMEKGA